MDPLPQEWNGIPIDTDYQIGIQMFWVLDDSELSRIERVMIAGSLLFGDRLPEDINELIEAVNWFLGGWNTDNLPKDKVEQPVMDYQQDQWRIWVAFMRQYGINLNRRKLHFWEFMALLRNLEECSFTRVVDIRAKKPDNKMSKEERNYYAEQKKIYALQTEAAKKEYTPEQIELIDEFDELNRKLMGKTEAEKECVDEFMRYSNGERI